MKKILQGKASNVLTFKKTDANGEKKSWKAALIYSPDKQQITFQFEDEGSKVPTKQLSIKCPVCERFLNETANYYMCPEHKKSCQFIIGKTYFGAPISVQDVEQLLNAQATGMKQVTFSDGTVAQGTLSLDPTTKRVKFKRS